MSAIRQVGGPRLTTSEDEWRGRDIRDSGDDASQRLRQRDTLGSLEQIRYLELSDKIHDLNDIDFAANIPLPQSPTRSRSPAGSRFASHESLNVEYDARSSLGPGFDFGSGLRQDGSSRANTAPHAQLPPASRRPERSDSWPWPRGALEFPSHSPLKDRDYRVSDDLLIPHPKGPLASNEMFEKRPQHLQPRLAGGMPLQQSHLPNSSQLSETLFLPYFPSTRKKTSNTSDFSTYSHRMDSLPQTRKARGRNASIESLSAIWDRVPQLDSFDQGMPLPPRGFDEMPYNHFPPHEEPSASRMPVTGPFQSPPLEPSYQDKIDYENIDTTSYPPLPSPHLATRIVAEHQERMSDAKNMQAIPPGPNLAHMVDHYLHGADMVALPPSRSASEKGQITSPNLCPNAPLPPSLSLVPYVASNGLNGADLIPLPPSNVASPGSVLVERETHEEISPAELPSHGRYLEWHPQQGAASGQELVLGSDIIDLTQPKKAPNGGSGARPLERRPAGVQSSYSARIQLLAQSMPHLKRLEDRAMRHEDSGLITRIDYNIHINNPRSNSRKAFSSSIWEAGDLKRFSDALSSGRKGSPFLRLLIVEDLSPGLMHTLGSKFNVDPELYADHLSSSGSDASSRSDPPTSRWSTSKMPKSYKSIKWYRPVRIEPRILSWMQGSANVKKLEESSVDWTDFLYQRRKGTLHETKTHHRVALGTNIFRRCRSLSTRPTDFAGKYVTATWEERASVSVSSKNGRTTLILVVDPLPRLVDSKAIEEIEFPRRNFLQSTARPKISKIYKSDVIPAFAPLAPRTPVSFPVNKLEASDAEIKTLQTLTSDASSTAADIESWIWQRKAKGIKKSRDPLIAVLRLAYIDSVDYLDNLGWTLDEIVRDSLDEDIMTRRLTSWRKLLSDLEIEVPALGQNLREFIDPDHADYLEAQDMIIDLEQSRIPKLINRVHAVHAALRSEMALLDSKRSIAEAKTMARLTELAFVFIPLTFACSGFSMQIRELEGGVPLWAFVIAAVTLGLITYIVRVILQSDYFGSMCRRLEQLVVASKGTATDQSVSISDIAIYLAKRALRGSGPSATFLLALAFPVLPIAFLWDRSHIDAGLNAMMTLLILPAGLVMAWYARAACIEMVQADGDDESSDGVTKLSMAEKMAMRIARLLASRHDPDSPSSSSESV